MRKEKTGYEALLEEVVETLKQSPEEVDHIIETSGKVVAAANDLTKDELALISAYVKADLKAFSENMNKVKIVPSL